MKRSREDERQQLIAEYRALRAMGQGIGRRLELLQALQGFEYGWPADAERDAPVPEFSQQS